MNILMVLTSHADLGDTGYKTGLWFDAFAAAYYVLLDAGAALTLASPEGGQPPIDPRSDDAASTSESLRRFRQDREARALFADTLRLDQVYSSDFAAMYCSGGYGSMWDIAADPDCARLVSEFYTANKALALVSHDVSALRHAVLGDGMPVVMGKAVTGTANSEMASLGLAAILPFSLQDELIALGGRYSKGADWASHVVRDGPLITGQNPNSAADAARSLLEAVRDKLQ
jgi:putative intracellular protease/amidase